MIGVRRPYESEVNVILQPRPRESSSPQVILGGGSALFLCFSFPVHLDRAARVHGRWTRSLRQSSYSFDKNAWRCAYDSGEDGFQRFLDWCVGQSSTTAVLFDENPRQDFWVEYAIEASLERDNRLLAIDLSTGTDESPCGRTEALSSNPLALFDLQDLVPTYHWDRDGGRSNITSWIEKAPRAHSIL